MKKEIIIIIILLIILVLGISIIINGNKEYFWKMCRSFLCSELCNIEYD